MSNHVENGNGVIGSPKYFNLNSMPHIVKALDRNQKFHPDILDVIGNTPLVRLNKIPKEEGISCEMYAKCEFLNPGGSVKDRIAYRMFLDAEKKGILQPGKSVIIEPTSGNTGIGLALAAAVKGYRCIIVLPEKMSDEKVNVLMALGAEIIRTPTEAASDSPESNISVARRLATEIPHAVVLDQYNNVCNPLAHYDGTAEEILWSMDDAVDMVVIGAGTCGTISGIGHKIKERIPNCQVVGVDPYGSILAQPDKLNETNVEFYEVEGIGYDFLPRALDRSVVDRWVKTEDSSSLQMARRLIQDEGLLCGASSGSAMWGAIQAARGLRAGQRCVVLLPDGVRNYMTKFLTSQWMEARHFRPTPANDKLSWWNQPVTPAAWRSVRSVPVTLTPRRALAELREAAAPAIAVLKEDGSIAGVLTADNVRRKLQHAPDALSGLLEGLLLKKYYRVDVARRPTLGALSRMLDIAPFVLVTDSDNPSKIEKPVGIITSDDFLFYTNSEQPHTNGNKKA